MKILKLLLLIISVTSVANVCLAQSDAVSQIDTTIYGRNKAVGKFIKKINYWMFCILRTESIISFLKKSVV